MTPATYGSAAHVFPIEVDPADIDFMGHVNNASYIKWVQAAVVSHWERLAAPDDLRQLLWVAVRHEITYRRPGSSTTRSLPRRS